MKKHLIFALSAIACIRLSGVCFGAQQSQSGPNAVQERAKVSHSCTSPCLGEDKSKSACPQSGLGWSTYVAPDRAFVVRYPSTSHPETSSNPDPALLSRTMFEFDQAFGPKDNGGIIRFSVQILVWKNPLRVTSEAWAKQNTNAKLVSDEMPRQVGRYRGYILRESNQTAWRVRLFVARSERVYEITYTDIATNNELIESATANCWKSIFDKMINSFRIESMPTKE